ncbi:hypothetical protein B9037_001465 [Klebsiella aerogenes]|uniref:hypothetical protein n=1 Tax=Klebsiella aerogenes TaxID=548 RepID=UPI000B409694|nr:hypothetical protein [Klebsiella aerogenes]MEB7639143.1 hypothetical protein [Klebsiella aerogenes]RNT36272.1 hypothetical protein B9037_001465 [Klebsiella aerogenes]HDS4945939.1 hypothetical protein [Klebsiella aerogenes]
MVDDGNGNNLQKLPWLGGIAGLIVGALILYFWKEWASWLPGITFEKMATYAYQNDLERNSLLPITVYVDLLFSTFLLVLFQPGYPQAPIVSWVLHNKPSAKNIIIYILLAWMLSLIIQGILISLPQSTLLKSILYILALLTIVRMLVTDAWRQSQALSCPLNQLRPAVIAIIALQSIWPIKATLIFADLYDNIGLRLMFPVAIMIGVLLAYLTTAGLAWLTRLVIGEKNLRAWRGRFALFNGIIIFCVAGKYFFHLVSRFM